MINGLENTERRNENLFFDILQQYIDKNSEMPSSLMVFDVI